MHHVIGLYKNISATHLLLVIYWRFLVCFFFFIIQTFIVYAHGSKSAMSVGWNINTLTIQICPVATFFSELISPHIFLD